MIVSAQSPKYHLQYILPLEKEDLLVWAYLYKTT